jgi:Ca-activated chloride channel family protein
MSLFPRSFPVRILLVGSPLLLALAALAAPSCKQRDHTEQVQPSAPSAPASKSSDRETLKGARKSDHFYAPHEQPQGLAPPSVGQAATREPHSSADKSSPSERNRADVNQRAAGAAMPAHLGLTPIAQPGGEPLLPGARDLGPAADREKLPPKWRRPNGESLPLPEDFRDAWQGEDTSTFAIDVDTASLALTRKILGKGGQPNPSTVRAEEFLNAFRYAYRQPRGNAAFAWDATLVPCPWNRSNQLLRVGVQTADPVRARRPPVNLVFLIDTSGSMSPSDRLPLIQRALERVVDRLDEDDRVAIVTYAGRSEIALESTPGTRKERIRHGIRNLQSAGSTAGAEGIRTAYALAREGLRRDGQNRVVLCTDGDFNVGISDPDALEARIAQEAKSGVFLTVLGVGDSSGGDQRMERLADRGNGQYHLLDSRDEARRVLGETLDASLVTVAQDVKIQVFLNPAQIRGWRLIGYSNRRLAREDFNDDAVDGGEVGAGHQVTALYEIIPAQAGGDPNPFTRNGSDTREAGGKSRETQDDVADRAIARLRLRYQPPGGGDSRLIEQDVPGHLSAMDSETAWAAAVAWWAESLQTRRHAPGLLTLARQGLNGDRDGRRAETIRLMEGED